MLTLDGILAKIRLSAFLLKRCCVSEDAVFPSFHPRLPELMLGMAIGLSLALAWHWVAWTIH